VTKQAWHLEPWRQWYGSNRWRKLRRAQLRAHPLCALCLGRGIVRAAVVVDHIIPHRGNWNEFLTGKLQSLCVECHNGTKERGYALDVGIDGWPIDPRHPANRNGR
jgi:5-methylcytosine-specific restriction enzyme A